MQIRLEKDLARAKKLLDEQSLQILSHKGKSEDKHQCTSETVDELCREIRQFLKGRSLNIVQEWRKMDNLKKDTLMESKCLGALEA